MDLKPAYATLMHCLLALRNLTGDNEILDHEVLSHVENELSGVLSDVWYSLTVAEQDEVEQELAEHTRRELGRVLVALYVDGKAAPYSVPQAIDHDRWLWRRVESEAEARSVIDGAVASAHGLHEALCEAVEVPPEETV